MAFDLEPKKTEDISWKSQAFINISVPTVNSDGTRGKRKIAAAALKEDKEDQRELIEWLKADPDNVNKLKEMLILDFQTVSKSAGVRFALKDVTVTQGASLAS